MNSSPLSGLLNGTSNIFGAVDGFMTDSSIDVLYKTFAVIGFLFAMYAIPFMRRFTVWAAAILLFLLIVQSQPNASENAPADSTLPLPTQINTPVPQQSSGGNSSSSSTTGLLATLAEIGSVFA